MPSPCESWASRSHPVPNAGNGHRESQVRGEQDRPLVAQVIPPGWHWPDYPLGLQPGRQRGIDVTPPGRHVGLRRTIWREGDELRTRQAAWPRTRPLAPKALGLLSPPLGKSVRQPVRVEEVVITARAQSCRTARQHQHHPFWRNLADQFVNLPIQPRLRRGAAGSLGLNEKQHDKPRRLHQSSHGGPPLLVGYVQPTRAGGGYRLARATDRHDGAERAENAHQVLLIPAAISNCARQRRLVRPEAPQEQHVSRPELRRPSVGVGLQCALAEACTEEICNVQGGRRKGDVRVPENAWKEKKGPRGGKMPGESNAPSELKPRGH